MRQGVDTLGVKKVLVKIINRHALQFEKYNAKKKKKLMAPFYGWGSCASRLEPLRGGALLFTIKFPETPRTHFIDLGRMKG